MIRQKSGFTLPELMITLLMTGMILAAASSAFIGLLGQSRTQGKIAESNESMIGLDILRRDIENAGYGLAWDNLPNYSESGANIFLLNDAPAGTPRAILTQDNVGSYSAPNDIFNGSDYLVIKAVNVARNDTCEKWTYVRQGNVVRVWTPANENLANGDRVIVLSPRDKDTRPLVTNGATFYTTFNNNLADSAFTPLDENDTFTVYGISGAGSVPQRPFNRADYFIALPTAPETLPSRCAPNTGILYKATMNHDAPGTLDPQALLDCVADMQVIFGLDTAGNGAVSSYSNNIAGLTAQQIRTQVKEVRVYILTHEGERDRTFTYPSNAITVGEFGLGHTVNLGTNMNYRWKVYRLIEKPFNLLN